MKKFGEILEAADELSLADQEQLVSILKERVREQQRDRLEAIKQARKEFEPVAFRSATPDELINRLYP
jgi:hypothetical protein